MASESGSYGPEGAIIWLADGSAGSDVRVELAGGPGRLDLTGVPVSYDGTRLPVLALLSRVYRRCSMMATVMSAAGTRVKP